MTGEYVTHFAASSNLPVGADPATTTTTTIGSITTSRTGEYTTGYVHGSASDSDKSAGVVALTMFDLRR